MDIAKILMIFAIVGFVGGAIIVVLGIIFADSQRNMILAKSGMLIAFIGAFCFGIAYMLRFSDPTPVVEGVVSEPDRSGYTAYLDGNEVDLDKIDLSLYNVSYDDENGIIYLAGKSDDSDTMIFIYD